MTHRDHSVAVAFFVRYAGFSYDPKRESKAQGRLRCARALAAAEAWARGAGYSFSWDIDTGCTSADWIERGKDGGPGRDPWATWVCIAHDADGVVIDSLGGVDFGRDGRPWNDPYRRVVEAELADGACARSEPAEV